MILGAHRIREHEDSQQRFTVRKSDGVVVHPNWDAKETVNDIALIPLPSKAKLNSTGHRQPRCRRRLYFSFWRLAAVTERAWSCPQSTSS